MYLKALEIQGFKSFPDKTVLNFGEDITAIVGPNGSGKSNISDAIRWVLGEQSTRTLRGSKMEDVIFGGTEKRSQVGFAQVTLVIDNTTGLFPMEENEVSVTRRYYRSGDSEYYINKQAVRLRDVNEMFMDTGLGREGYSIIGQGKIDELLSVRSGDRRGVFEEAAGISRFRHRKEDSERKLRHTEENLLRINDKIAELELQVHPLRKQAETAKRYLLLRDELRGLEVSLWVHRLSELHAGAVKLQGEYEAAHRALEAANRELEDLYRYTEQFSGRMASIEEQSDAVREAQASLEGRGKACESEIAVMRTQITHYKEDVSRALTELEEQQTRSGILREQMDEHRTRIAEIEKECAAMESELEDLLKRAEEASGTAGDIAEEAEALRAGEALHMAKASEFRAQLSALQADSQNVAQRSVEVAQELEGAKAQRAEREEALRKCDHALFTAEEERDNIENMIGGYTLRLEGRRGKEKEASDRVMHLTMERSAMQSRIRMLTEMEKEYEGFSKAVRRVMQASERKLLRGIAGPVAGLMKTEDQYTVAIEVALGAAMQNIVVEREEDAKAAISFLKKNDGGRATFLPISALHGDLLRENVEDEYGFVGLAISLISFDRVYEDVFRYLLGRTVIVEDLDCGIAMARKFGSRFRIVTLDGQVMNRGGSMTGGSVSRSAGILSRANELKRLNGEFDTIERSLLEANKQRDHAQRELTAAQYELETAEGQKRSAEDTLLQCKTEREHHRAMLDTLTQTCEQLEGELRGLTARGEALDKESDALRQKIEEEERVAEELRRTAAERISGRADLEEQANRLSEEVVRRKETLARLRAEGDTTRRALTELERVCADMTDDREKRESRVGQSKAEMTRLYEEIAQKEQEIAQIRDESAALGEQLKRYAQQKLDLEAERTAKDRESRDMNERVLRLERETARLEQEKASGAMEEKQILDKMWENYELSYEDARRTSLELESVPKTNRRIGELRRQISSLGTPNIGAIEEFERVNTRYEYLTSQRSDIEKAKEELQGVIDGITEEMRRIFKEQFTIIDTQFRKTFLELFGGGKARLELEDEDDILECGIEIKVQPPGKTLKTISLLSGGEKAFVAIALYFSIMQVHPTPFCVMDEVEAALDEANVVRCARYMRRIAGKTQFIVITHRRGTMEEADVLYGVTMQERGVSRVLTINLNDMARELKLDA